MSEYPSQDDGLRARLARSGEDAVGRLAQDLLENPVVSGALSRALDARDKAAQAQEVAMGALNLPSAADLERLTRRLRSVSQRLEGIEDGLDRVEDRIERLGSASELERRLAAIDQEVGQLAAALERHGKDAMAASAATAKAVRTAGAAAGKEAKAATAAAKAAKTAATGAAKEAKAASAAAAKAAKAKPPKAAKSAPDRALEKRLAGLESGVAGVAREVHALRDALPDGSAPVPREQERLAVEE